MFLLLVALYLQCSIFTVADITANTTTGALRGFSPFPNVHAYLGIPYAKPPVGDLRFAPPQPLERTTGIRDCYRSSPGCFQHQVLVAASDRETGTAESEDILTINLWKPATSNESLPVMIFLYGGAFVSGATALPEYDGTQLVADQGIIVATINYRLNIFGFPNSPAITVKNPGLLDQRLGVEWLRDNIKTFGGDPSRMTLSGQSAGSQSVAIWSYAYPDDPIVSGLIEFSGQASLIPPDDGSSWKSVANTTGCSNPDANAELECMRSVPPRQLKRAIGINNTPTLADPGTITGGVPAVDNVTIFAAADYKARGETGRFTKVPLLLSNTLNEADLFLPYSPADGVNTTLSDEITLVSYHCPVAATASYWAAQKIPTWRYVFSGYFEETIPYSWMRPFHGADTELVFGLLHSAAYQDPGPEVQKAGNYIQDAVAAFVRDPVHGLENFGWKTYNPNTTTLINLFGNNSAEVTFTDPSVYDLPCQSL